MRFAAHFDLIFEMESQVAAESLVGNFLVSIRGENGARNGDPAPPGPWVTVLLAAVTTKSPFDAAVSLYGLSTVLESLDPSTPRPLHNQPPQKFHTPKSIEVTARTPPQAVRCV